MFSFGYSFNELAGFTALAAAASELGITTEELSQLQTEGGEDIERED